jgi:hypothetical protein
MHQIDITMQSLSIDELKTLKSIAQRERDAWEYVSKIQIADDSDDHLLTNAYFRKSNIVYLNRIIDKLECEILKQ